jgi:ferredoxin
MKKPVVELSDCSLCGVCVSVNSEVFRESDAGYIEVAECESYPEEDVNEAIKNCPENCIFWEED